MKLIVWLWNPGNEYTKTRHNAGFLFLDFFRKRCGFSEWKDSKHKWVISEGLYNGEKTILLKPMTYMNLSGESVVSLMNFYKVPKEDLIIVFDDLDMEFWKVRFRSSGSAGGHNGIKSIIASIGSEEFSRVKIGIGRDAKYSVSDWVLSRFSEDELKNLQDGVFLQVEELFEKHFK